MGLSASPHDGRSDPSVELINRAGRSPLKWNLDKFSVLMLPASMWALSLRPLKEKDVHGVGKGTDACARDTVVAGNGAPKPENLLSEEQWLGPGPIIVQARLSEISRLRRRRRSPRRFSISSLIRARHSSRLRIATYRNRVFLIVLGIGLTNIVVPAIRRSPCSPSS